MPPENNPSVTRAAARTPLDMLVESVQTAADYRYISPDLIRWVGRQELQRQRKLKEAVKSTRSRLHQTAAAYQGQRVNYDHWLTELAGLPQDRQHPLVRDFCRRAMEQHASTRERLPILEEFFGKTLAGAAPVRSMLDIGCGMNPLALPWMPLAAGFTYTGLDVYTDQAAFLNAFLAHIQVPGEVRVHNILNGLPEGLPRFQTVLLLKTLSCLEQLDKTITARLLPLIQTDHLVISYPLRSLGGRSKGMLQNYQAHFEQVSTRMNWTAEQLEFKTELAYIVKW